MNKILVGALLVLALSQICLSGHIYTWDVDLFYQNEKNAQRVTLFFSLESGLARNQIIRVKFPDTATSVVSGSLSAVGQTASSGSLDISSTASGDVYAVANVEIPSNTWYQLVLNFGNTYVSNQTPGYKGVIYIETASGTDANRIIYDSNSVAGVYQLAPRPTETLGFTVTYPSTVTNAQKTALVSTYDIFFDLKPQVPIKGGTKIRVELDTVYWKLGSSCNGADQTCAEGAAACENITLVAGSCTVGTGNRFLELVATSDIVKDQTVRIKTTVTNPSAKRTSAGVTAYSISKIANLIFEKKALTGTFSVDGINPTKPTVKYLWGVSTFTSTKTLCPLGFYKRAADARTSNAAASKIQTFNDLTLEFSVATTTPAGQNLEVSIATPSADFTLVLGSIRTDLPVFSGKTQTITFSSNTIAIRNVAPLSSSSTYKVLAKVAFASSASGSSAFAVTLKTLQDSEADITLGTSTAADIAIVQNYEYFDLATNGYHATAPTVANPAGYNYVFSNTGDLLTGSGTANSDEANALTYMKTLFYHVSALTLVGYPGVGLSTLASPLPVKELIFIINPSLSQLCCKTAANCENSAVTTCDTGSIGADNWVPAIGLFMVANSNILNLDNTASARNGVITYGGFWGGCGYLNNNPSTLLIADTICLSNGKTASSTTGTGHLSVLKNQWDFSESGVAYLQAVCIPKAKGPTSDCLNIASTTSNAATVSTYSALGLKVKSLETNIFKSSQDKVSQLYGSQQVIDFVVCFGSYTIAPNAARPDSELALSSFVRASQALLNVYIMNYGDQVNNLRVSLFNYLRHASSVNYHRAPIFLRVSGYIGSSTYSALTIFLDNRLGISNAKQCTSSASSATCNPYASDASETGNPVLRSRVDIISSIASGSSAPLEFFVPVAPFSADVASGSSLFIDVGLSSVEENYILVKEIYRIYGNLWGLHGTTGIRLLNQFATNAWSTPYDASTDTVDGGSTCADSSTGFSLAGANFQPGYTHETLNLPTSVTAGCLGAENGDVLKGGTGFTAAHYSGNHDFLGSGSAKWNDAVTCLKFRIDYSDSINSNGFVCGFVGSASASNIATASINVVLRAFTVPWTWGASYNAPRTAYSWSGGAKGQLRAYKLQANMDTAQYQRSCTTSDWGTVYKSSSLQRLTFTFSPSAGIDLTWETFSLVANFNANLDGLSIGACSITPSAGSATCQGSDTTFSSKTIAVTRTSSAPRASLAKGTQTVVLTVSQSSLAWAGSVTSATYTATIWNSGTKVDSCETTKTITYSSSDDTPVLSLGTPILQTSKGSRTSFQFTFTVGATSRQVWASTKLDFVLGWLGDNLAGVAANLHCFIRTGNSVSFGFRTLDLTTPASPSLIANTDLPVGSWTYVCNGARAPALSATTKLTFSWKTGSTSLASIAEDSANAVAALSLTDSQAVLEASLKSKLWATPGVEASYTFLFKPKRANYTLEGRVYVDFSIDIPPRGNEAGLPSCEINSTRVYCEWAQERRLVVWPVIPLTALTTQTQFSYELAIHGIAQPPTLGSFKSIGITLDLDSNPNNGVSEWAEITDSAPSTAAITPLLISEYSNSNSVTRSNTEIKINLNIPKDTIVKDARVYVELPAYFGDSLWLVSSVTCNLYRISDLTAANLVQNCTLLRNRRVKIFTNLDSGSNVDNIYVLSIGGVPTPAQPTLNAPNWATVFLASSDETTVTHRTAPGYINATQVVYNHEANKQVPDWFVRTAQGVARVNGDLEVTIGTYRSDVILRSPTVADVSYNFALGGEFISNLAVFPSNLRVVFGEPESRFRIGAKANAVQGRYLVTTTKSNEQNANRQIPIPTLPILVRNNTCTVQANNENIKIPAGGWSLPIIFDFADCMPVTDVQIDANFTDADKYNISFGPEVSNTLASEKLVFESWNNTRISFLVRSFNASQKAGLKTKISFTMSGTNKDSYGVPRVVNVELVDSAPFNVAPTVTTLSATPAAGQVTLNLACSASGNIYFAIGTNPDIQSRSVGDIKNSTYAKKISLTPRDPTDAWWRVNGFVSQTGTTAVSIVIPGVKSAALYYAVAYCQNQMEIPSSNNLKTSWNQTDNGGRIAKATLVFNATLTQDQQKDIACALANLLKVPQNTVMTQDGVFCSTLRRLQSSNSSNSSNSTNSTPTVQQNVSYSWFVLPDYAGVSSSIHTNLQSQMVAGFTDKLFALTTGKANTFPMVRSFSFFAPSSAVAAIPSTNEINPTINIFETYVTFDITLSNSSGYVYWGIGSNSSSRPVGRILRDKTDANGVALVAADRKYVPAKTLVSFNATSSLVRNDTDYKLYISLSSDDPGAEAVFSDVVEKTFRTKKPSFSGRTVLGSLLVGLLLLLAVFV